ncbi:MAG TPA: beta-propeller fold lactonase family protein, partial [Spirochaetia bacterium]|nr:beta-propeller fold lactonase family protein [Spirochaetia bacterium]
ATVTMSADASAAEGSYYFKLAEGSALSALATLSVASPLTPVVDLGSQVGELVAGAPGSASFPATTANLAAGTAGTVSWFSDPAGTAATSAPAGVSASVSLISGNAVTVTMTTDADAGGGTFYFKLAEGSALSAVATLTIFTPTASLGSQSGTPRNGAAGSASFAATTSHVASGAVGTISWYADQAGATATSAPTGVTPSVSAVSGSAATVTMTVASSASIGSYYFRLAEGQAVSNLATLTVYPSYALYAANYGGNNLSAYAVDANTGALGAALPGSPYATGSAGAYPFSVTVDPAGKFVYVANLMASSISVFSIDSLTGGLAAIPGSPFATAPATDPRSIQFDPTGAFAYVPVLSGAVYAYSVDPSSGAIGAQIAGSPFAASPGLDRLVLSPDGKFAFASKNGSAANLWAYSRNSATGALSAVSGSPFAAGNYYPSALAIDPSGKYLYAGEDFSYGSGKISAYAIDAAGALSPVAGAPFDTGDASRALAIDPEGKYLYVSAQTGGSSYGIYVYSIDAATGALAQIAGSPFDAPYTEGMIVDPRGKFLYRAALSNNELQAYSIDAATGAIAEVAGSPFAAGSGPKRIALVELH